MLSYWQSTRLGWTSTASMFAVATVELPLASVSVPTLRNGEGSIDRYCDKFQGMQLVSLILLGYAILLIFIGVLGDLVLRISGVGLNMTSLLPPVLLLMCAAPGNLALRAVQKGRGSALPG